MGVIIRTGVGIAMFAAGLTFLTYGLAQAIENGSCGTDEYGRTIGAPCPSGFGPMIMLMVLGTFVAILGAAIASYRSGSLGRGMVGGAFRFFGALTVSVIAGVVLGIVDVHPDDTRPGMEIVAVVVIPVLLFALPGVGRKTSTTGVSSAGPVVMAASTFAPPMTSSGAPAAPSRPATPADAEELAGRLRQLDQLRESGLLEPAEYERRRRQILAEL